MGSISLFLPNPEPQIEEQLRKKPENEIVDYAVGLGLGVRDFLIESAKAIILLIEHPIASMQGMVRALINYQETYSAVKLLITNTILKYPKMGVSEKGRLHARLFFETLYMGGLLTVPSIGIGKLEALSRFVEKSGHKAKNMAAMLSERTKNMVPKNWQGPISFAEWFAYDAPPANR